MEDKRGPILMGLAYLALVVFIMVFCAIESNGFDEFSKYWGLFGTLIGVATGAIPAFFFKTQADKAGDRADQATKRAEILAGITEPEKIDRLQQSNPDLFG